MADISDAAKAFARKRNVPTELVTADFELVDGWMKERAFWMAGVVDGEVLQQFRGEIERIGRGESGGTEAINRLTLYLEQRGYKAPPGAQGTIKDLLSWQRMTVSIDTNIAMARGYGMWFRAQKSLRAYPAWRFYRLGQRKEPRDWPTRWKAALELTASVPGAGDFVALINHPIWSVLSAFGSPYPLFDYGSGMQVKPVPRSEAKKLGLLDDPRTREMWENPRLESPNARLEMKPDITSRELRDALANRLKGLAHWDGDKLIHSDPNGTRPMPAQQLADVWRRGLPEGFQPRQQDAFLEWVRDSRAFNTASSERKPLFQPGTDRWEDFDRFLDRLENAEPAAALWRGLSMDRPAVDRFIRQISADGYSVRNIVPAESWTASRRSALNYAGAAGDRKWSVVIRVDGPQSAKDITPLVREFAEEIGKQKAPTVELDAEWLYKTGQRFRVVKIEENAENRMAEVILEEIQ